MSNTRFKVRVLHSKGVAKTDAEFDGVVFFSSFENAKKKYESLTDLNYYVDILTELPDGSWKPVGGCSNQDFVTL